MAVVAPPVVGLGADSSTAIPGATLAAAGVTHMWRYLSRFPAHVPSAQEIDDLHGNGIGVLFVYEDERDFATSGRAAGKAAGQLCLRLWAQLGVTGPFGDRGVSCALAVDADLALADVRDTFAGFAEGLGFVPDGYAGVALLKQLKAAGLIRRMWAAGAASWWHDEDLTGVVAKQWPDTGPVDGTDGNDLYTLDLGAWLPGRTVFTGGKRPPQEDELDFIGNDGTAQWHVRRGDGRKKWIPDPATLNALKALGVEDKGQLAPEVLAFFDTEVLDHYIAPDPAGGQCFVRDGTRQHIDSPDLLKALVTAGYAQRNDVDPAMVAALRTM